MHMNIVRFNVKAGIWISALLCCAGVAFAQGNFLVVPNNLANTEGNSSMSEVFSSSSFRLQQVFDASQFAFLGNGTCHVFQLAFRVDGAATSEMLSFFGGVGVVLSTTQRGADSLSPVDGAATSEMLSFFEIGRA